LNATHIDAFLVSAFEMLGKQAQAEPDRGSPVLRSGATHSSRELTALVVIKGDLTGVVFYSMSLATAAKLGLTLSPTAAEQLGTAIDVVREAARAIVAGGIDRLEVSGCRCSALAPVIVEGFGAPLTVVSPVLTVPLFTQYGDMDIGIAMHPAREEDTLGTAHDFPGGDSREAAA
jgi:CheY-specific phosphatase CheX